MDLAAAAATLIDAEKGVASMDEALSGARDIIAEWVNEDQKARARLRDCSSRKARSARMSFREGSKRDKYKDYYDWEEPISSARSHGFWLYAGASRRNFLPFVFYRRKKQHCLSWKISLSKEKTASADQVKMVCL
jgi:uncharacterized protein